MNVLLIEDTVRLARLLELELNDAGYEVNVIHDGVQGLQQALSTKPDLILVDWMLPGLTGLEICSRLRAQNNQTPVVFMTSLADQEHCSTAMAAGADDYVVKPFQMDTLMATMENIIQAPVSENNPVAAASQR